MHDCATREWPVTDWGTAGVVAREHVRTGAWAVTELRYAAGAVLGEHPAGWWQRFAVLSGSGWVSAADGVRRPVAAGDAVAWEPGEVHASGAGPEGMVALVVQAAAGPLGPALS